MLAMSKRNRRPPSGPPVDLGPLIRHQRGELVTEFRPDPDNPQRGTVKGAKVRVWYHVAWIEGRLSDEQHEAADRYQKRLEQAEGATEGSAAKVTGIRAHGYSGPTDRQMMALADLREANKVLGDDVRLVQEVVGENMTPPDAKVPAVRAALQRLAEYWGM